MKQRRKGGEGFLWTKILTGADFRHYQMCIINFICLLIIAIIALGGIANRLILKRGIGIRFCQFLAIGMGIPAIIMLSFADKIEKQAVASLIGAIIGFFVARSGKDEDKT